VACGSFLALEHLAITACGLPLALHSPASRSASDNRSACDSPPAFFQALPQFAIPPGFPLPLAMARACQAHQPAGVPFAHLVLLHRSTRGCPKSRRLYQFFESTSFRAQLSNVRSATTCFSLQFSSSSCFSFLARRYAYHRTSPSSANTSVR
jgi:hypothetical protein